MLRRVLPSLRAESWIIATTIGAVVAWMLGAIPSTLANANGGSFEEPGLALTLLLSAAAGAALGLILGVAQWIVLRAHIRRASLWIAANAIAWTAGMPLIFLAAGIPEPHTSAIVIAALVLLSAGAAGAVVGAIEGAFLRTLLASGGAR